MKTEHKLSRASLSIRKRITSRKEHKKAAKSAEAAIAAPQNAPSSTLISDANTKSVIASPAATDRLSTLPPEIQHIIFEHLLTSHINPPRVTPPWQWTPGYGDPVYFRIFGRLYMLLPWSSKIWRRVVLRQKRPKSKSDERIDIDLCYPLLTLAATSKNLLRCVEDYSRTVFLAGRPNPVACSVAKAMTERFRVFLVRWNQERCRYCNRRQQRRGVFCNQMAACFECEAKNSGPRITERDARLRFFLTTDQLYSSATPPEHSTQSSTLPTLTYGKSSTCTWYHEIMFFQLHEVKRFADAVFIEAGGYRRERARRKTLTRKPFETLSKQDVLDALPLQLVWTWHMNPTAIAWVQLACSTYKEVKAVMDDLGFYPLSMMMD